MKKRTVSQIFKFACVGVLNSGIDFGVFTVLTYITGWHSSPIKITSYSCGMINSYIFNKYFTFKSKTPVSFKETLRFIASNLAVLAVSILLLNYFAGMLSSMPGAADQKMPLLAANAISIVITMILNFILSKIFVFTSTNGE